MLYENTAPQFAKTLRNLLALIEKGAQFAESKKIDPTVLMQSRLAPDQFDLIKQIQIACDTAKLGVARVAGKEAPKHEDNEKTIDDIRNRIKSVVAYLETFSEKDFVDASERRITTPRWEGKTLSGSEFVVHHAIPNFYFHVTTAYSILRHNGVEIGKKDFLGPIPFKA